MIKLSIFIFLFTQATYSQNCVDEVGDDLNLSQFVEDIDLITNKVLSESNLAPDCPIPEKVKNLKEVIIGIDGTSNYSPLEFKAAKASADAAFKGKSLLLDTQLYKNIEKERRKKIESTYRKTLEEFYYSNISNNESKEMLYFSHTHKRKIFKCISEMKKTNPSLKIKISGYSWGGDTVQRLVNKLNRKNIEIESVFTVDPVRKGLFAFGVTRNLFSDKNASFFTKKENVKKYYNVYQKTDESSLFGMSIKGNSVRKSDVDINLSQKCTPSFGDNTEEFKNKFQQTYDKQGHILIAVCSEFLKAFQNFIDE